MKAWLVTVREIDGTRRVRAEAEAWDVDERNNLVFQTAAGVTQVFAQGSWLSFKAIPWERPGHEERA